jgi:carboxymethylenebutenolidase
VSSGLILLHAWWGLNDDVKHRAEILRKDGYTVVTPDLFGGRVASTIEDANKLSSSFEKDEAALTTQVEKAVDDLGRSVDSIGIVAWSFGVWYAWKMGITRADKVKALALFYGIGPNEPSAPTSAVLSHYAEHDPYENIGFARQVEKEMKAAGSDITVELYPGTKHWFDEPSKPEYDKAASELAWRRNRAFLEKHLGAAVHGAVKPVR